MVFAGEAVILNPGLNHLTRVGGDGPKEQDISGLLTLPRRPLKKQSAREPVDPPGSRGRIYRTDPIMQSAAADDTAWPLSRIVDADQKVPPAAAHPRIRLTALSVRTRCAKAQACGTAAGVARFIEPR